MADVNSGQQATYSFLVHSSSSPDTSLHFENPANPKQKRRRTSPHDHAILEAAYLKNSKPDKKERAEIVGQVDLGEKEVQIWFQNRRQNDRRKSKPLQPHELIAHFRNAVPLEASPSHMGASTNSTDNCESRSAGIGPIEGTIPSAAPNTSRIHDLLNPPSSSDPNAKTYHDPAKRHSIGSIMTPPSSFDASQQDQTSSLPPSSSVSDQISIDRGRKRSHDFMIEAGHGAVSGSGVIQPSKVPTLKKSTSFVRLAMTVDGAVKVRTNNEMTPSPPKQRLPPATLVERKGTSLTRSQSDVQNSLNFRDINPPIRRLGRDGFGRSRDARTWEFYCDRDSGDMLETQVEAEETGSAIGAINLIRSSSQRSKALPLTPNSTKQNSRRLLPEPVNCKPKLSRARSSMARLQSHDGLSDLLESKTKRPRHERSSSGDSDKENWAPGTRASQHPLRRMQPLVPRSSVLTEHGADLRADPIQGHPLPSGPTQPQSGPGSQPLQDIPVPVDTPGRAKAADLDCIQGLLSLSQGAWR